MQPDDREPPVRSVWAFFALTFAIAWGGMGLTLVFQDRLAAGQTAVAPAMRTLDPEGLTIFHPGFAGAGGGFVTTAADLAPWGRLLWSGGAMQASDRDQMLRRAETGTAGPSYGPDVVIDRTSTEGEVRGPGGWIPDHVGSLRYYPAPHLAIAIKIDSDVSMLGPTGAHDGIERAICTAILKDAGDGLSQSACFARRVPRPSFYARSRTAASST